MDAIAARTSSSVAPGRPIRTFSSTVPWNRWPSWGPTTIRSRSEANDARRRSTPPYDTVPDPGSYIRAMSLASVDLPAPVGPTSATRSPRRTVSVTSASTGGPPLLP